MSKLIEKYKAMEVEGLEVHSIENINHNPHPFVVGPKHVAFCADNYGGMLGDACMKDERFPTCAARGCYLRHDEHTSDRVMAVKLTRNLGEEEARTSLQQYVDAGMEDDGLDGFVFIKSEFTFILEEEE